MKMYTCFMLNLVVQAEKVNRINIFPILEYSHIIIYAPHFDLIKNIMSDKKLINYHLPTGSNHSSYRHTFQSSML